MATIFEHCKSKKRRKNRFEFQSFGNPGSTTVDLSGTFRDNIRSFLQECAQIAEFCVAGMPTWSTLLVCDSIGLVFPLYTIEETVQHSLRPFCDHCKCAGWGHHFVSKRRYHIIIPAGDNKDKPLKGNSLDRCTHLLHSLIHCNGFGHLLSINGLEDHSKDLGRADFMDLWDRICTMLRTRKISVNDCLMNRSREMRLLHSVAYGQSWFGNWGYKFGRGSFGLTEHQYNRAINDLSSLKVDTILSNFQSIGKARVIQQITRTYRDLSETQLITVGDLLRFMLTLESRAPSDYTNTSSRTTQIEDNPISSAAFVCSIAKRYPRWPEKRLEHAVKVVVNQLKENKRNILGKHVMSRKELRDAARQWVGDTGLIDFVLKSINSVAVGDQIVRRFVNPSTKLVEFAIHEASIAEAFAEPNTFLSSAAKFDSRWPQQRLEQAANVVWNILMMKSECRPLITLTSE